MLGHPRVSNTGGCIYSSPPVDRRIVCYSLVQQFYLSDIDGTFIFEVDNGSVYVTDVVFENNLLLSFRFSSVDLSMFLESSYIGDAIHALM